MEKALIISDQCPACKALLESLKQHGQLDKYRVLNASSPEGSDVVQKLGITGVPDCIIIVRGSEGEMARRCTPEEIKEILKEAGGRE